MVMPHSSIRIQYVCRGLHYTGWAKFSGKPTLVIYCGNIIYEIQPCAHVGLQVLQLSHSFIFGTNKTDAEVPQSS